MTLRLLLLFHLLFSVNAYQCIQFSQQHELTSPQQSRAGAVERPVALSPTPTLRARPTSVYRPRSYEALNHARQRSLHDRECYALEWDLIETLGPDIEDLHTLAQLARMSGNAYALPGMKRWYEMDPSWNVSFPVGWEDTQDGFRGHVFISSDNSTVVLSIKGTTVQGPTSKRDKFNDNLLFSCCCALVDLSWIFKTVCKCFSPNWKCDDACLSEALIEDSLFYSIGVNLVNDLLTLYPTSNIWLVGHSLGGALASLLGSTYGLPAVAFESPGERLAAHRLHLPLPPPSPSPYSNSNSNTSSSFLPYVPITHVYHNSDPIPQGTCTGFTSPCFQAGYALETKCHLGKSIVLDTVGKLGWRVDIRRHVIRDVITKVLEADGVVWGDEEEGREVPEAKEEVDCVDCFKWEFGVFN
ncbi:alpha/beta-hydrolase [Dendrothele bispora CBS 962.96]|uniref:triacylglycerol lipase n=1 Tax=Dendrothele bispora (strain CBS 962.96) TaxID=1314807 RepID=A0A4S8L2B0_DENBC|nr:alpha/beta-hydrolase [Dendrothele bispora CBS 962.96]THU85659.1 alpha/beta-hydrolase [Dendrothele bispora CBS 962.96]